MTGESHQPTPDPGAAGRYDPGGHVERFDHVAFAVTSASDALPLLSLLGASYVSGGHHLQGRFRWLQFALPGGLKVEVLAPLDPDDRHHFLTRFLSERGPGVHHLTFKVHSLDDAIADAVAGGFDVVGVSKEDATWHEAFIHPRSSNGILVQIAEFADDDQPEPLTLDEVLADPGAT